MKHQLELWRGEDMILHSIFPDKLRALYALDDLTTQVHSGRHGIGSFQFFIYELAIEGHVERNVLVSIPFSVPRRLPETA